VTILSGFLIIYHFLVYWFLADRTLVTVKQLSWLSSSVSVRSSLCFVAKWCKIGSRLLLITTKKSHTGFQMTYQLLTLDDPEGCYMRFSMEKWPYLRNGERYGLGYYYSLIESGILCS